MEYKIYALKDPETKEIRYVGKTVSPLYKRLSSHYKEKSHTYKSRWVISLVKKGLKPIIELIEVCGEDNWQEREKYWIAYYKNPKLTNHLDGGQGLPKGYKHTSETIEKIRIAALRPNTGKFTKNCKWNPLCAENCKKIILQYDLDGNFIKEWRGIITASTELRVNKNSIISVLKGRIYKAGDFLWRYYTENYPKKIQSYKQLKQKL